MLYSLSPTRRSRLSFLSVVGPLQGRGVRPSMLLVVAMLAGPAHFWAAEFLAGASDGDVWEDRLYNPTLITKLGDHYFIVDCWHNRLLVADTLDPNIQAWETVDGDLAGPHSIDTDSNLYVVDDAGRHQLRVYTRQGDSFEHVQTVDQVGTRPHRVIYDEPTKAFYVIGSTSQTVSKLISNGSQLELVYTLKLDFLQGTYTRSMSIIDGHMYFVSGPNRIYRTEFIDDSYAVLDVYEVPDAFVSMNDLYKIGDYYYITSTDHLETIIRTDDLATLEHGGFEDVKDELGLVGTPYYLSHFDGKYFLPQATQHSGIISFDVDGDGAFSNIEVLFDSEKPRPADHKERFRLRK